MQLPLILAVLLIVAPSWVLANAGGTKPPGIVEGPARIIDGDTIDISGQRIRLNGIDAPESRQTCIADGVTWPCGQHATTALTEFIGGAPVSCQEQGTDRYGRMIGKCSVQGEGIEAWMVESGWALAYRRYSSNMWTRKKRPRTPVWACGGASLCRRGSWRKGERLQSVSTPESGNGCAIKGNISSKGERIFHSPGDQHYARTKINTARCERWFCSEAEAVAAGWRKAKR